MQFRSTVKDKGLVWGYQADIAMTGPYLGGIWDEYGPRKSLAARGEKNVIDENGKNLSVIFAAPLPNGLNLQQWNEYHIIARGTRLQLKINVKLMCVLDDREKGQASASGVSAMPIIPGEPITVQYADIWLKKLSN
jgi:hypothetical protein